jgi:hypothetical protein
MTYRFVLEFSHFAPLHAFADDLDLELRCLLRLLDESVQYNYALAREKAVDGSMSIPGASWRRHVDDTVELIGLDLRLCAPSD